MGSNDRHINPLPWKKFNPLGIRLYYLLQDTSIRQIVLYGGSSSGKSFSAAQMLLICTALSGENVLVMRKVGASISKSIYEDFKVACDQLGMKSVFRFVDSVKSIRHTGGSRIDFAGLDDPEKIKGISNYRWVFMDEWSEFDEADFKQIRKRLRGKVGQQIITAFNPIKETHWIKKSFFDEEKWVDLPCDEIAGLSIPKELCRVKSVKRNVEKSIFNPRTKEIEIHAPDTIVIQSTYLNNFWVVGSPDGTYGYYDEQCIADFEKDRLHDPDYYQVYALGEWGVIRTGSEFFASFSQARHVGGVPYDEDLPIHVSVDSNVLPYITITGWQIKYAEKTEIRQIFEICAETPNNTVRKSAKLLAEHLRGIGYDKPIHLHGDSSTRAANNIDEQKRSFHDLFISTLESEGFEVVDKVSSKNPNVPMSGEFINAIFDGLFAGVSITVDEGCKNSIEDYLAVQKDENGGILKTRVKNKTTGQSYEEHGHISDTFRYVAVDLLNALFLEYSNKRKRNTFANGAIHFFNPDTKVDYKHHLLYALPNVGGKFVMVHGGKAGDTWHILDVAFTDTDSVEDIKGRLLAINCGTNVFECPPAYFPMVRELRANTGLTIKVIKEYADIDRRIAATSDYVKSHILFMDTDDAEYNEFINNLLDYNKDGQSKEASAVLSGFIMHAEKSFSD